MSLTWPFERAHAPQSWLDPGSARFLERASGWTS